MGGSAGPCRTNSADMFEAVSPEINPSASFRGFACVHWCGYRQSLSRCREVRCPGAVVRDRSAQWRASEWAKCRAPRPPGRVLHRGWNQVLAKGRRVCRSEG